jgi:hypothetical protein
MANTESGNTWYIDSTGSIDRKPARILYIILSPTSGATQPRLVLTTDQDAPQTVLDLWTTTTESKFFDFSLVPIQAESIKAGTVTDCVATVILRPGDQQGN